MIKEIYRYQFPVCKIEAVMTVFTFFVALVLANAIWETTVMQIEPEKYIQKFFSTSSDAARLLK